MAEVKVIDNRDENKKELEELIEKALVECGITAQGYAILLCPVDTGRLRNSIVYATSDAKGQGNQQPGAKASSKDTEVKQKVKENYVCIGSNVEYAPYVENGTSKRVGRHFLMRALSYHVEEYKEIFRKYFGGD